MNKKFLPQESRKREATEAPLPGKRENVVIFILSLIVNLLAAILFHFIWGIGSEESLSLTGRGFFLLYARESPLLELLLVDPPLPTFLQLAFIPILKLFGIPSFSGPLASSLFGALSLVLLNRILFSLRLPKGYRWSLLGLTQCFPSILYTSAIGTPETLFILIVLVVIYGALQIRRNQMAFLICGFGLTLGFLVKYETIGLIAGAAIALIVYLWNINIKWRTELEGWMLAFLTPPVYGIGLWLILNSLLISSPLYFLNQCFTTYHAPTIAENVGILHPFYLGWGQLFEASAITFDRSWHVSLVYIFAVLLAVYLSFSHHVRHYISVLIIMVSIPGMYILMILLGKLSPWIYIWSFVIPFGAILIGMSYRDIKPGWRDILMIIMLVLTVFSIYLNFNTLEEWGASIGEQRVYHLLTQDPQQEIRLCTSDPYWVYRHDAPIIAKALDQYTKGEKVLIDARYAAAIAFESEYPSQLVVVENLTYQTLFSPTAADAAYILILNVDQPLNEMTAAPEDFPISEENVWASKVWSSEQTVLDWQLYKVEIEFLPES